MSRRLRVGVPEIVTRYRPLSAPGRIWSRALASMSDRVDIVLQGPSRFRLSRRSRRIDAWLVDGHQGALDITAPVVAHLHEAVWSDDELNRTMSREFVEANARNSAAAAQQAAKILTVSKSSRAQIIAEYGRDPDDVFVAHLGIDHDVYRPGLPGAAELIAAAGGEPTMPYVLFVSTVHPRKNLDALRTAVAGLAARGLEHALVLVAGPAPDRADSTELSAGAVAPLPGVAAPVVNLYGAPDSQVARLMAGAAVLCQPSLMEGFGMAVTEAMACGAPVVVSNCGSLPEVVGDAGDVTEPTAAAVEEALAAVLGTPGRAAEMSRRSLRRARDFSWEAMADIWFHAILQAVEDRRG